MKYTHPNIVKAVVETLEDRRLLSSTSFADGVLNIQGDANSPNKVTLRLSNDRDTVQVSVNNKFTTVPVSELTDVKIVGGSKTDLVQIDPNLTVRTDIQTGAGNDWISGGGGNDSINAGEGGDFVDARGGHDFIVAGAGNDRVYAGDGNDIVDSDGGNDTVLGGKGNDKIYAGDGDDHVDGKEGNDTILAGQGNDRVFGGDGNDYLDAKEGKDTISGGNGDDQLVGVVAEDTVTDSGNETNNNTPPADDNSTGGAGTGNNTSNNGNVKPVDTTTGEDDDNTNTGGGTDNGSTSGGGDNNTGGTDNEWDDSDDNTGEAGSPNPIISTLNTGTQYTGQAVHVNGLKSALGSGSQIEATYEWNFGDAGSKHNVLKGFNAAHVYDKAGTYTITLKITNKAGKVAYETAKVTVAADNRRVIYVDAQGNDANSGTSSSAAVRTWDRAKQLLGDNTEILFERGDTFAVNSAMTISDSNVIIGAYGSGDRPVLNWGGTNYSTQIGMATSAQNVVIQDLTFNAAGSSIAMAVKPQGQNITVRNNQFLKVYYAINSNAQPQGVFALDNVAPNMTSIKDYFAWVAGSDHVYAGNKVANSTNAHVIRMSQFERVAVADNDFANQTFGGITIQKGEWAYVSGNDVKNAPIGTGPLGGADGIAQDPSAKLVRTRWVVIEDNVVSGESINVGHGSEHVMIRNNVVKHDGQESFNVDGYDDTYERGVMDVYLMNNTAVNNSTSGKFIKTFSKAAADNSAQITMTNNLYVAPKLSTGATATAVVYVQGSNLNSFREIGNNVWPVVNALSYAQGGAHYVWSSWSNSEGYRTGAEWESFSQVKKDYYENVTLKNTYTANTNGVVAGSLLAA